MPQSEYSRKFNDRTNYWKQLKIYQVGVNMINYIKVIFGLLKRYYDIETNVVKGIY